MTNFSIKELETFSGIKAHTIRTWEQRFSFLQPSRSTKLRRTYCIDELKLILDISLLNRNGHKISQIAKMDRAELNVALAALPTLRHKQEKAINELIVCTALMDAECFEMVIEGCVLAWGIHDTIQKVIVPFAQKAGLFNHQPSKEVKPQVLIIEQCVKQKIITGIEKTPAPRSNGTVLFFLSKRSSELELLYLQYLLKSGGFHILYISSAVSASQLITITDATNPLYVITSLSQKQQPFGKEEFLQYLHEHLSNTVFLNLGGGSSFYKEVSPIRQMAGVDEALQFVLEREKSSVEPLAV